MLNCASVVLALVLHTAANNTGGILHSTGTFSVLLVLFIVAVVCVDRMWRRPRRGTRYASSPAWT